MTDTFIHDPFYAGKRALITGAGSGIGQATAYALARRGAALILADLNPDALSRSALFCESLGAASVHSWCVDVADVDDMQRFAENVLRDCDAPDLLINNAGIGIGGSFLESSLDDWHRTLGVNVMGVVHGCKLFLPRMIERGTPAHVVNLSSMAGYFAAGDMSVYATSKFAVLGFSESLRAEMQQYGIGVSAVCPGIINTAIAQTTALRGPLASTGSTISKIYRKRNYGPEKVAEAILHAARDNIAVLPVSPEAWFAYAIKRTMPELLGTLTRKGGIMDVAGS